MSAVTYDGEDHHGVTIILPVTVTCPFMVALIIMAIMMIEPLMITIMVVSAIVIILW